MKKIFLVGLVGLLAGCANVFETPATFSDAGYDEAAKLYSIASDARYEASKAGQYFDCSDFTDAVIAACPDCQGVTVEQLDSDLLRKELHAFAVTPSGWAIDIQANGPYEHDPATYLLRHYMKTDDGDI